VIAIAVVKVPIEHQHLMLLKFVQRALTDFFYSTHGSDHDSSPKD